MPPVPDRESFPSRGAAIREPSLVRLLSQALVAFTVELDNEFEHRSPHRTTRHGGSQNGPRLSSMVMFLNCMRFVGREGISARRLFELARTETNLNGMRRWGYISVAPGPDETGSGAPKKDWIVHATPKGRAAREVWQALFGIIEDRWAERFGADEIARLRRGLCGLVSLFDLELPDCMPILKYGLFAGSGEYKPRTSGEPVCSQEPPPMAAMMARALVAFAIEYELECGVGLPVGANVLRVVDDRGVRLHDLPALTGVSKEAIAIAIGFLSAGGLVVEDKEASGRSKSVRLTRRGKVAAELYAQLLNTIEERWAARFGRDVMQALTEPLGRVVGDGTALGSPLFGGLQPYPDGWRSKVRQALTLPYFPMVLHRGGYPDGS